MKMHDGAQKSDSASLSRARREKPPLWPSLASLVAGIIAVLLTISLEHSVIAYFGNAGFIITALLFPGLLGSMAIAGNVHAFSLWIAAGINCIFYFLLIWMIWGVSRRIRRKLK